MVSWHADNKEKTLTSRRKDVDKRFKQVKFTLQYVPDSDLARLAPTSCAPDALNCQLLSVSKVRGGSELASQRH